MTRYRIAAGAAACSAVLFVSACAGDTSVSTATPSPTTTAATGGAGGGAAGRVGGFPGAVGLLAQIDGTTLQVQGTDTQTAVTYSAKTTFTNTTAARRSDVVVGGCVQARSARPVAGAGSTPTTAPRPDTSPIVAATVEISPAVNGQCSPLAGFGAGGGRPPGAAGQPTRPPGAPEAPGAPNPGRGGGPGAGGNGFGGLGAFGKITAVNGASFTVESARPPAGTDTSAAPTTRTVQTAAGTKYTRSRTASAKALVVGRCITAQGKADDTGSITAASIAVRPSENGSCSTGFSGRAPGGSPTPAGGNGGA
jgi:Domain of unknown function (DUF5666)